MASVDINVDIKGVEKIDRLNDELKKVEKSTESVSTKAVAMGNIYAELARVAVEAFVQIHESATEYQNALDELNGTTSSLADRQEDLSTSFGQLSASILNTADANSWYNQTLKALDGAMLHITSFITDKSIPALVAEQEAVQKATEAKKKLKEETEANTKALEAEAKAYEQAQRALSYYNAQQQKKVDAHKEEIEVLHELIYIYEEQGRNTDELIDKLEKLEEVDVLAKQTIREKAEAIAEATLKTEENTQAVEENTQATQSNTSATEANTNATEANNEAKVTYTGTGATVTGAEAYATYALGFNMSQPTSEMERYLREIAESTRDTNDAVRGY